MNMKRFLLWTGGAVVVLVVAILLIALFMEIDGMTRPRREPLRIEVSDTNNPFDVRDRHDDTRYWIDERINERAN